MALTITADERTELERRMRSRKGRAEAARRARVILMLADGASYAAVTTAVGCPPAYVAPLEAALRRRTPGRPGGAVSGQPARVRTPALEAKILAKTQTPRPMGVPIGRRASSGRS